MKSSSVPLFKVSFTCAPLPSILPVASGKDDFALRRRMQQIFCSYSNATVQFFILHSIANVHSHMLYTKIPPSAQHENVILQDSQKFAAFYK